MTGKLQSHGTETDSSAERLRLITKTTQDTFWDWDLKTNEIWRNDGFKLLFGYPSEETESEYDFWYNCIHPEDRERVVRRVQAVVEQGGEWSEEYRFLRANGSYAYVHDRGFTVRKNNETVRMVGTMKDITEERRKNEVLQNFEKRFQAAFDKTSLGIVIGDIEGTFLHTNKAFCQITGYAAEELYGQKASFLLCPDDLPQFERELHELLTEPADSTVSRRQCIRKDGSMIWLTNHTIVMRDDEGAPESLFSIVQDITQDIASREDQQRLSKLVENSMSFMGIADLEGRVVYLNQAGRELVGLSESMFAQGVRVADFYTPEHLKLINEVAVPTLLSKGHWSGKVVLKHFETGELIPCHANGVRVEDPVTGKPIGRGFTMRDLRPELAAQETQRKLLALMENSVELMSILELDGTNSYLNKAGREMLGFDNEQQVFETPIADLHTPEDFDFVKATVLPAVLEKGRWSGQMAVRHLQSGEVFPVFNNTIRIDDSDSGKPIAVGAVMRDMRTEQATRQALVESESRFRNMIMQAPVAIGMLRGKDLVIESANDAILNLWGKDPQIINKPLLEALPEIKGQGFVELLEGVCTTGNPFYGYEVLAKLYRNGQLEDCYFNFVYAPVREPNGKINGVMVVATEVTPQVKARKELEESEKRFRNLVLDAPMATAVYVGPEMVIQLANDAMLRLWGKDASVIGKKLRDALPELEGQPFHQLLSDVYTTGVAYQGAEDRADLFVNGRLQSFYFNFTYKPLRDAEGKVYAILNMALDITYQVEAKQQLREAEERLREAVDLAELATWSINLKTGEIVCSDRIREWLGVSGPITADILQRSIPDQYLRRVDRIVQLALRPKSGGKIALENPIINQATGERRILRTKGRIIMNEEGKPYLIRGKSQDITRQRMTEQELESQVQIRTEQLRKSNTQLEQSNQELERYAYVASHDLQEPLRKIQIYSGLFSERFRQETNPEGLHYLQKIEESANRMSVLIKNILDFSRINHDTQFVRNVDLNDIVGSVVTDLELFISQKRGQVKAQSLISVEAIPLQMTQLFYNLISNSLKFARKDVPPVIRISGREMTTPEISQHERLNPRLRHYEITVSDNGIGFDPSFADKIFGLFHRLHHRQNYEGTGIGLALCLRIVTNHGGEIRAEGYEGQGAIFRIVLPIARIN